MMNRLLRILICAVLLVAGVVQAGNEASRELAQKVFREATGWKEYRLSGAKGLGGLFKPGEKSASSREMSLFQRGLPWSAPQNLI